MTIRKGKYCGAMGREMKFVGNARGSGVTARVARRTTAPELRGWNEKVETKSLNQ
jgi:hypothetical protein